MRIVFVRHGEPDYEHDCLTEQGKANADMDGDQKITQDDIDKVVNIILNP